MDAPIRTQALTKIYRRKFFRRTPGIRDLDLEVRTGEIFGYLGPNGAGKTTTLRCLVDLLRPTSGEVLVLGESPRMGGPELRRRIGYLPGDLSLEGHLTSAQLFEWFGHLRGSENRDLPELVERLELDVSQPIRSLSKGNRQKVGIIQALMHRPELAILDEPTSGLDPIVRDEFQKLVREGSERGQTFLLSSHAMDEVQSLAHRVGIVRSGRLVMTDSIEALRERASRSYSLECERPLPPNAFSGLPGVERLSIEPHRAELEISGSAEQALREALRYGLQRVESAPPDLAGIFLSYYQEGASLPSLPKREAEVAA